MGEIILTIWICIAVAIISFMLWQWIKEKYESKLVFKPYFRIVPAHDPGKWYIDHIYAEGRSPRRISDDMGWINFDSLEDAEKYARMLTKREFEREEWQDQPDVILYEDELIEQQK